MAINSIGGINTVIPSLMEISKPQTNETAGIPFADYLKSAMNETNDLLLASEKLKEDFAAGKIDNLHEVLIAGEKADIALQFTMQIRNKIMDAYSEIMRMQI